MVVDCCSFSYCASVVIDIGSGGCLMLSLRSFVVIVVLRILNVWEDVSLANWEIWERVKSLRHLGEGRKWWFEVKERRRKVWKSLRERRKIFFLLLILWLLRSWDWLRSRSNHFWNVNWLLRFLFNRLWLWNLYLRLLVLTRSVRIYSVKLMIRHWKANLFALHIPYRFHNTLSLMWV